MTFDRDPPRWTAQPELAPDALREPFAAARHEGPSELQMKTLALKLAAVAAGTAVATGAATAKAAATTAGGASMKAAGTLTLGKALASLAIVGAVGTSAVVWQRSQEPSAREPRTAEVAAPAAPEELAPSQPEPAQPARADGKPEPTVEPVAQPAPVVTPLPAHDKLAAPPVNHDAPDVAITLEEAESADEPAPRVSAQRRADKRTQRTAPVGRTRAKQGEASPAKHTLDAEVVAKSAQVPSEVELLRRARAALASTPRTAYTLTQEHREHYPRGVFAQERDALAIEALLRAGDKDVARDLARRFIRDYPASPHAHRFRETMGL